MAAIHSINYNLIEVTEGVVHTTHDIAAKASEVYAIHINNRKEPRKCNTLSNVNDLLKMTKGEFS